MDWTPLINLGAAGAVIIVVREFLRHIAHQRHSDRDMWSNHLGESIKQQAHTAEVLERLATEHRILTDRLR